MKYKFLGNNNYLIFDEEREYGVFHLIPVLPPNPEYCKHMEMFVYQEVADEILNNHVNNGDMRLLVQIFRFVFDSVLEITHDIQGAKYCKLHSNDELLAIIYRDFAEELNKEDYEVKYYRKWIEIHKKG